MSFQFDRTDTEYIQSVNAESFVDIALALFLYQYYNNKVYHQFVDALNVDPSSVATLEQIPYLPISFFKTHQILTGLYDTPGLVFESSGTTGEITSKHYVHDEKLYEISLIKGFEQFYGPVENYTILALLPSYLERKNASLVHMARVLMEKSVHADNGFYLNEWDKLATTLQRLDAAKRPTLLLGVTFALLDFASAYPMHLQHIRVMETGGMKGRREEWTRTQVHDLLKQQWGLTDVHSEYGMTELLSQAYALKDGIFLPTATMQVLRRDLNDPMELSRDGVGCINIIDLANVHSCAFIATEDIGRLHTDGHFEVLGRMDNAALRGCNLMVV